MGCIREMFFKKRTQIPQSPKYFSPKNPKQQECFAAQMCHNPSLAKHALACLLLLPTIPSTHAETYVPRKVEEWTIPTQPAQGTGREPLPAFPAHTAGFCLATDRNMLVSQETWQLLSLLKQHFNCKSQDCGLKTSVTATHTTSTLFPHVHGCYHKSGLCAAFSPTPASFKPRKCCVITRKNSCRNQKAKLKWFSH